MSTGIHHVLATHTVAFNIEERGIAVEIMDEASFFDRDGSPSGWIMLIDVQGDQMTANDLRSIADAMDAAAARSVRKDRYDV